MNTFRPLLVGLIATFLLAASGCAADAPADEDNVAGAPAAGARDDEGPVGQTQEALSGCSVYGVVMEKPASGSYTAHAWAWISCGSSAWFYTALSVQKYDRTAAKWVTVTSANRWLSDPGEGAIAELWYTKSPYTFPTWYRTRLVFDGQVKYSSTAYF
jgi:hypothetical protein